ncbi:hypothetical protein L3Y34_016202 [Caenorhabditis briggsae]|uniref:Sdz-33 F-box domain-containing protein n=1 Tax=Caenorhabditis briggsae TaxID=6238 RepID=A0AAE9J052_CAEBR|nr:hypothetical protein L3Y34_016202 [Caenorhabditis briggsae]
MEIERVILDDTMETRDVMDFMPLIHEMNITRKFSCFQDFPPNFHHQLTKYPNKIHISCSFWFSINQLLNCTCTRIKLHESMFTNQDLDVFLQKWKTRGAFPNLRWLEIRNRKIDNESPILEMIPPITTANNPKIKVSICNYSRDDIVDGVRVTNDDGKEGWLKVLELPLSEEPEKFVAFIPRSNGNLSELIEVQFLNFP